MDDIKFAKRVLDERRGCRDLQEVFETVSPKQSSVAQTTLLRELFHYERPYHDDNFLGLDTGYKKYEDSTSEINPSESSYGSLGRGDEYGCENTGWGSCGDRSCNSCYPEENNKFSYGECDDEEESDWGIIK